MDIWAACQDQCQLIRLQGELIRIVESQEQIATNALVDSLKEQAQLEEMLEANKPPFATINPDLHYLLATPFRYPPLKYGSRFGSRQEPSLFYGSASLQTALSETAYYRFVFWSGMATAPPAGKFITEHTSFTAQYKSDYGLKLHTEPFGQFKDVLTDPCNYKSTQLLGENMRTTGIEAFEYHSARDIDGGLNIALYKPAAFTHPEPISQQNWICDTSEHEVILFNQQEGTFLFQLETFTVNNKLPHPAL